MGRSLLLIMAVLVAFTFTEVSAQALTPDQLAAATKLIDQYGITDDQLKEFGISEQLTGETLLADEPYSPAIPEGVDVNDPPPIDFDFDKIEAVDWPPTAEYDYNFNIISLYKALNTFRMNLTVLEHFAKDQRDRRMIGHSVNGYGPDTYACLDYYSTLNPYGICGWRGFLNNLPNFWREVRA